VGILVCKPQQPTPAVENTYPPVDMMITAYLETTRLHSGSSLVACTCSYDRHETKSIKGSDPRGLSEVNDCFRALCRGDAYEKEMDWLAVRAFFTRHIGTASPTRCGYSLSIWISTLIIEYLDLDVDHRVPSKHVDGIISKSKTVLEGMRTQYEVSVFRSASLAVTLGTCLPT
jgi:hypothetical protein